MSVESTASVSLLSIGTDLALHLWNYGFPMPTSMEFLRKEEGLAFMGTTSGILTTTIASSINSAELTSSIAGLKSDYDRKLLKVMISSSVINIKMLTQTGVVLLHSLALGNSREQISGWLGKQFIPSLFIHGIIAGTVPYFV